VKRRAQRIEITGTRPVMTWRMLPPPWVGQGIMALCSVVDSLSFRCAAAGNDMEVPWDYKICIDLK
jgi:hypothetical protein